jgi:hypothetical protein
MPSDNQTMLVTRLRRIKYKCAAEAADELERINAARERLFATFDRVWPGVRHPGNDLDWLEGWMSLALENLRNADDTHRENIELHDQLKELRVVIKQSHELNNTEVVIPSKVGLQYHFHVPAEVARELHRLTDIVEGVHDE